MARRLEEKYMTILLVMLWAAVFIALFSGAALGIIHIFDNWCRKKYDWRHRKGKK